MTKSLSMLRSVVIGMSVVIPTCVAGLSLLAAGVAANPAAATSTAQQLTVYSVATAEQFVNNEDDRARGAGNNPFGNYTDTKAETEEQGHGPFAGDEALFTFTLYRNASLTTKAGSAVFTCQYDLDKNAFSDASYSLSGGTLFGAGEFNFNASTFTLAITGGDGRFGTTRGVVATAPSTKHTQRVVFTTTND